MNPLMIGQREKNPYGHHELKPKMHFDSKACQDCRRASDHEREAAAGRGQHAALGATIMSGLVAVCAFLTWFSGRHAHAVYFYTEYSAEINTDEQKMNRFIAMLRTMAGPGILGLLLSIGTLVAIVLTIEENKVAQNKCSIKEMSPEIKSALGVSMVPLFAFFGLSAYLGFQEPMMFPWGIPTVLWVFGITSVVIMVLMMSITHTYEPECPKQRFETTE